MVEQGDHVDAFLAAMTASNDMDDRANYLRRGRAFAGLSDDQVRRVWIERLSAWVRHRKDEADFHGYTDAHAELGIRGLALPHDAVRSDMELLRSGLDDSDRAALRDATRQFAKSLNAQGQN